MYKNDYQENEIVRYHSMHAHQLLEVYAQQVAPADAPKACAAEHGVMFLEVVSGIK